MDVEWLKAIFGVAEHLLRIWQKIPRTEVLNQEATINVPESVVDYTLCIKIPSNFRSMRKNIEIIAPSIIRASASSLYPMPHSVRGAVKRLPSGEGYVLYPKLLPPECEIISMSVSYDIGDVTLLDDLVERTHAHEPSGPEKNEYWISAQLKHPKVLIDKFGRFDLRDVDVTVDVGIYNELKTTIPRSFVRRLRIFFDLMSETDPRQQFKVIPELRRLAMTKTAGREFDVLKDLETIFLPGEFSKFVEVLKDFRYSTCYKGKECYELPIEIIPKKMLVVSRTDLTLEKLAAEGILVYKQNLFRTAIENIFSQK